ncbi:MAG TPA: hypothetical protein VMH00_01810 [Candidatus Limnocylindrales bacterium]|nr:hypothetical protein [Candidatus Limnocylindrales bacterium]
MKDEIAQTRVILELKAEKIFGLPLMPVCGVDLRADAGKARNGQRKAHEDLKPSGESRQKEVAKLPVLRALFDYDAGESATYVPEQESAKSGKRGKVLNPH